MLRKSLIGLLFFLFVIQKSLGQYVESGQDPAAIKWLQINTEHFQLIFPADFTKQANLLANALEAVYQYASATLKHDPDKISVILHNYNSNANASVLWAPKRSDFNTIPPQDVYPQFWLEQLAIHEFRHVVQVDKMNQGFTKILYFLLGQQATAGVFGLHVPFWFVEGDAVATETSLSKTGRGRLPSFEKDLRAQLLQKGIYSYEKAYLGSYKDFVPNYYTLGYYLTTMGRMQSGPEMWENALELAARKPYRPAIFNKVIKNHTGNSLRNFYKSSLCWLDSMWSDQLKNQFLTDKRIINDTSKKNFTSYAFPQYIGNNNWVVFKSGYDQIPELIKIDLEGKETHVTYPGISDMQKLSVEQNKIVWAEFNFDIRWSNRIFSDIVMYDMQKKKRRMLTRRRYLFAPDLSPNGKLIAAVEATPDSKYSIVIFDAETGSEVRKISAPGNGFLITPEWSPNGEILAVIVLNERGKTIQLLDLEAEQFQVLLPETYKDISLPVFYKDYLLFHGTWSGIDNIYAIHLTGKQIYQVTGSRFGAFYPEAADDGSGIAYSDFSVEGFNLAVAYPDTSEWLPFTSVTDHSIKLYEALLPDEMQINFDSLPKADYQVKPYRKWKNLFYLHSWSPASVNVEATSLNPSVTLLSQNLLSTSVSSLSYVYDYNEAVSRLTAEFTYKGLFPVFSLAGSTGGRRSAIESGEFVSWHENRAGITAYVPFNLSGGKYYAAFRPLIRYTFADISRSSMESEIKQGSLHAFQCSVLLYRYRRLAYRDIRTRWGQDISAGYRFTPFGSYQYSSQIYLQSSLFLPGLIKHHSIYLEGAYQENLDQGNYNFSSSVAYPRGFTGVFDIKVISASMEYLFPWLYPDLPVGSILYIKRIYSIAFIDVGIGTGAGERNIYKSLGVETISNLHFLSHILPFSLGVRYAYLPDFRTNSFQVIFNLDI